MKTILVILLAFSLILGCTGSAKVEGKVDGEKPTTNETPKHSTTGGSGMVTTNDSVTLGTGGIQPGTSGSGSGQVTGGGTFGMNKTKEAPTSASGGQIVDVGGSIPVQPG